MQWINSIVDAAIARQPEGEILVSSGASPSGTYHFGHLRELITCDAIVLEIRRRGRQARHVHVVDNLDGLRKIPVNIPAEYEKYLGMPLCDIPAPDGSDRSYADYFLDPFIESARALGIEVDVVYSHEKYRAGYFVPAIERSLERIPQARAALETVSGRQLDEHWTPIQIMEQGRLKNRRFVSMDTAKKTVTYIDAEGVERSVRYDSGEVKLDWRLDWPGRWWLMQVIVEPFGRDHATKGGSYDTGVQIMQDVYEATAPIPVPYDFVNRAGDTKKMSASKGTGIHAHEAVKVLPAEVARFFMLRFPPSKRLYFDQEEGVVRLVDEFAALSAKTDRSESEEQLLYLCTRGLDHRTVSRVPFSHLVASYQAALKDTENTVKIIERTEHADVARQDAAIIKNELGFIDEWLRLWAPDDVRFELAETVHATAFTEQERAFLAALADKVASAPADADGSWFHVAIYDFKETMGLSPKDMFVTLYKALIGKTSGPRAGWFLSILPRDWLIQRLRLKDAIIAEIEPDEARVVHDARLTDSVTFRISDKVLETYPSASIGYIVADVSNCVASDEKLPALEHAVHELTKRGITADNLSKQPEIAVWRQAYSDFGVKPSKYLCSAEALAKRALKGNPARVSPVVDAYNAVSIARLVPMGAVDLEHIEGDVVIRYGEDGETADLLGIEEPVAITSKQVVYADDKRIITWLWNHRDAKQTATTDSSTHIVFFADSLLGVELAQGAIDDLRSALESLGATIETHGIIGNA